MTRFWTGEYLCRRCGKRWRYRGSDTPSHFWAWLRAWLHTSHSFRVWAATVGLLAVGWLLVIVT